LSAEQGWKPFLLSTEKLRKIIHLVIRTRMKDMLLANGEIMKDNISCCQSKDERQSLQIIWKISKDTSEPYRYNS